jgi:DNA-binding NarL/FixJ family response regulator
LPSRILLVDDHAAVRLFLRRALGAQSGFEVCGEAVDGRDGIEKARQLKPDLIVLDLSMPVMNGFEAARTLQALMPAVPIVLYTSYEYATLAQEALNVGISAVVSKTEPLEALVAKLQSFLKSAA